MSKSSKDSIRALCRQRIAALHAANGDPSQFEDQIVRLVKENLANGRFEHLASGRSKRHPFTLADYVDSVIYHTRREHRRLHALAEGDPAEWNQLRTSLYRYAYRMTLHFHKGSEVNAESMDFAQQACLVIFAQRYPSDVSFDAWAMTILKNLILAHYTRSSDVLSQRCSPESLDTPHVLSDGSVSFLNEVIADPQSLAPFEKIENQLILLNAIAQLRSVAQRQVIIWTYLDQLEDAQIAERLHKKVQDIYNLRSRALARLNQILTKSS